MPACSRPSSLRSLNRRRAHTCHVLHPSLPSGRGLVLLPSSPYHGFFRREERFPLVSQRDVLAFTPPHPSATDSFSVCLLEILRVLADSSLKLSPPLERAPQAI